MEICVQIHVQGLQSAVTLGDARTLFLANRMQKTDPVCVSMPACTPVCVCCLTSVLKQADVAAAKTQR